MADFGRALGRIWGWIVAEPAPRPPRERSPEQDEYGPVKETSAGPAPLPIPEPAPQFHGDYKKLGYAWRDFERSLKYLDKALKEVAYDPYLRLPAPDPYAGLLRNSDPLSEQLFLLPRELKAKTAEELVATEDLPELPRLPAAPPIKLGRDQYPSWYTHDEREVRERERLLERASRLRGEVQQKLQSFEERRASARKEIQDTFAKAAAGDRQAQAKVLEFAHTRYTLPQPLRKQYQAAVVPDGVTAIVQVEFPDFSAHPLVIGYTGKYSSAKEKLASPTQKRKLVKQCLYSCIVRAAYVSATVASNFAIRTIVVNVEQSWFDSATGQAKHGFIASLQAPVDYLLSLDLSKIDADACFKHLKGIATPALENASPIRPIMVLDKTDDRFVANKAVDEALDTEANLAAMPWEDFEHLVAQLFEWEFAQNGIEVRVTRASRDRGVDAILFDPDPLRGGKYVIQAKRYTRPVDVSAVRDLFGTVMNEGANRGILISTSSYGPDAYEFAKDKPLSLVDGPNLLHMLQKHGKQFRIDLEEARRLNAQESEGTRG